VPYSPEDIVAYEFRLKARGYDRDEVDRFLDELADQVEQAAAAQDAVRAELADLKTQVAEARESEMALKRTLVIVQDASERAMAETKEEVAQLRGQVAQELADLRRRTAEEAEQTLAQAQAEARAIVDDAERSMAEQRERIGALQQIDAEHRRWLREHLDAQLEALHALPDPFAPLAQELAATAATATADGGDHPPAGPTEAVTPEPDTAGAPAPDTGVAESDHDPWRRAETGDDPESTPEEQQGEAADPSEAEDERQRDAPDPPMWS
jgi:DivIVA domain-containing protein